MIAGSFGEMSVVIGLTRAPLKQPIVRPGPIFRADANRRVELPARLLGLRICRS